MPKKVTLGIAKETILLEDKPFASGGEGELFKIISPAAHQFSVAKIYFKEKRTSKQEAKINYLIANPPELASLKGHQAVIWLQDSVFEEGVFIGFIMPFAKGAKLEILCSNRIPKQYVREFSRFSLKNKEARDLRLKICFNIATAVFQIHKTHKYVLVDLKPDNIIIQSNGLISIVDIDSVQVVENERMAYPARVATPEFSPPEYYGEAKPGKTVIFETWDRFGVAVIFYKLLFGIHPYAGTSLPPYDTLNNLQDKIKSGLFIHAPSKKGTFQVIPPPHKAFHELPAHLQNLFIRCFEYGHENVYERPTANEWCWGTTPRPPLITMRKLPSMALPMRSIHYTKPISLNATGGDFTIPNLQPVPPSNRRHKKLDASFKLTRLTAVLSVFFVFFWIFFRPIPFTFVTLFQIFSIGFTNILVAAVDYYSLPVVKTKSLTEKFKLKFGKQKREKRHLVNQLIRQMQRIPKAEQETQNEFYQAQTQILQEERLNVDKIVNKYRQLVGRKDQEVLKINQTELKLVQDLEANLLKDIDLTAIKEIEFLPLPDKVIWIAEKIEKPDQDDSSSYLDGLKKVLNDLRPANEIFEKERKRISTAFEEEHQTIQKECETAHEEITAQVALLNETANKQKEKLFKGTLSSHAQNIEKTNEAIQKVKKGILELEDLFQNFNEASNTLLEYKHINFIQYMKQAYLFRKPNI